MSRALYENIISIPKKEPKHFDVIKSNIATYLTSESSNSKITYDLKKKLLLALIEKDEPWKASYRRSPISCMYNDFVEESIIDPEEISVRSIGSFIGLAIMDMDIIGGNAAKGYI